MLYVSYGCGSPAGCTPYLMKYDVRTDQPVWTRVVPGGIDSHSITPDGRTIYMPTGEADYAHTSWLVIDTSTGDVTGQIDSGIGAPHNTIVSSDGARVYMDAVGQDTGGLSYLVVAHTSDNTVFRRIGPVLNNVTRPFTLDVDERFAFILPMGYLGFQVGDVATGSILYTVPVAGYTCPYTGVGQGIGCNHGISLSPDGREIYMVDFHNNRVHVYDVTGLPATAPQQVDSVALAHPYTYSGAWATHTRDGRFVLVGRSGDVIDTATRSVVGFVPALGTSKVYTEIDFQNGRVVFTPLSRSGVGYPR
jgi:DNA-binding beta-propeller fold protein YncE